MRSIASLLILMLCAWSALAQQLPSTASNVCRHIKRAPNTAQSITVVGPVMILGVELTDVTFPRGALTINGIDVYEYVIGICPSA
jgi:hypothetical protein